MESSYTVDTYRLMTALEKWESQGAQMDSGSGPSGDADESVSGDNDLEFDPNGDPFESFTEPSDEPSRFHTPSEALSHTC